MKISPLPLAGCRLFEMAPVEDERGYFARLWCRQTLAHAGLQMQIEQTSASFNHHAGTIRGLHFAWPPAREDKLVRCARGRMHDVLLDLRPDEATYGRSLALVLDADAHNALYVPAGLAHGFQTLTDNTEVHYMMSEAYRPELSDGVRYNDPRFAITWPLPVARISERDAAYADFDPQAHAERFRHAARAQATLQEAHRAA